MQTGRVCVPILNVDLELEIDLLRSHRLKLSDSGTSTLDFILTGFNFFLNTHKYFYGIGITRSVYLYHIILIMLTCVFRIIAFI